jgi:hypothetical protein
MDAYNKAGITPGIKAENSLHYLDLNAISPRTANNIASAFAAQAPSIRFIDGGIIGSPPSLKSSDADAKVLDNWNRPSIPISGPKTISDARLAEALNTKYLNEQIGTASALKCSFASLTKGFTALALQSYVTASNLNILPQLRAELSRFPALLQRAEGGIMGMRGKEARWVAEMEEIGTCHKDEGGWGEDGLVFGEIADVFFRADEALRGLPQGVGRDVDSVVAELGSFLHGDEEGDAVENDDR